MRWRFADRIAVSPTVKSLFRGIDVHIFAYGVTGSGKTHTVRGGKTLAERGIIPRLLSAIYRRGRKIEKDSNGEKSVEVTLSYYEIYNDKVFDLFEPVEKRPLAGLPIRDCGGKTVVAGLTDRPCGSLKEFEELYDGANVRRSTSATKVRSLYTISGVRVEGTDETVAQRELVALARHPLRQVIPDLRRSDDHKHRLRNRLGRIRGQPPHRQ